MLNILFNLQKKESKETYLPDAIIKKCVEINYTDSNKSKQRIKLIASDEDNLTFTIDEVYLYLILIMNAKDSAVDGIYHISTRKIRDIRGLNSDSKSSYERMLNALNRLSDKMVSVMTISGKYTEKPIVNSPLLKYTIINSSNSRILEFSYELGAFSSKIVKSKQFAITQFNPFCLPLRNPLEFQICMYLIRMVHMNKNKFSCCNYSVQKMLFNSFRYDSAGIIQSTNQYQHIEKAGNKQSEYLKATYESLIKVVNLFQKSKLIKKYELSKRRSFKYLRDNEVDITLVF